MLGFIAARIIGTDPRSALRERVFARLGMVDTGFWIAPEKRSRIASFYVSAQPGQFAASNVATFTADAPPVSVLGGQGLTSTADDYRRFARMLMNGGTLYGVRISQTDRLLGGVLMTGAERASREPGTRLASNFTRPA